MCNNINWSICNEVECIGLSIFMLPQMCLVLNLIYLPTSSNKINYSNNVISNKVQNIFIF